MAPDRTSRNGGFSLPAKRNSALATAAMASAALLSQTGNAAADEGPSRDEVSRRVTNLYDRAENDSGTYNATRAARTASSNRDRTGSSTTGGGRRAGSDPALDDIAKQWYGMARAKTGPMVEATLPSDRVANRRAETSSRRPAGGPPAARDRKPAERSVPELTATPMPALPTAPQPAPAALTATPAQSPAWAPEPAPRDLNGTGEIPALGTSPLVTGVPEYTPQPVTGTAEYGPQLVTGVPEYIPQPVTEPLTYTAQTDTGFPEYTAASTTTGFPQYSPQIGTGHPDLTAHLGTALPEYTASITTGFSDHSGQLGTALPEYATPAATGFPEHPSQTTTGFPEYPTQAPMGYPEYPTPSTAGFPEYPAQTTTGLSEFPAQATTGHPEYSALTAPLAALAPPPVDTTQSTPLIPSPRTPEPSWQAPRPTPAPAATPLTSAPAPTPTPGLPTTDADLPAPDPGYDSKVIQVLAFARSQIGKPCLWGAAGPGSYDNSGLTQAAWKVAGVSLPRTSLGQASSGTAVPLYAIQPGDLVFFHDDFSHVGLCTGNGMMIHAPGPGSSIREESIYPTGESIIRGAVRPA